MTEGKKERKNERKKETKEGRRRSRSIENNEEINRTSHSCHFIAASQLESTDVTTLEHNEERQNLNEGGGGGGGGGLPYISHIGPVLMCL